MEPDLAAKTFCPVIHLTAFLPWHQAQTPALQHLPPVRICTAGITDGDSPCSARQQKPGVVAASPKMGSISQPSPGNICNSVLPLGSLTRALVVLQGLSTDYNRLMVNVASKDKEETCLQQKSQPSEKGLRPPPSFSTVLYDSEQAIYNNVQCTSIGFGCLKLRLRGQRQDFKNEDVSLQLKLAASMIIISVR